MATSEVINPDYQLIGNDTGRIFRVGEEPGQILGYPRGLVIMAAWLCMCLAGLLEYTWAALAPSLQPAHHWGTAPTFWLFSFYVIFESFVQIGTGFLRNRGLLPVRWATIIGGIVCGLIAYLWLAYSGSIWTAYASYALLGGIGSGMVYSSCINIVAKWYPEKKGWRTGFVNGGWAYGSVPFIIAIGGFAAGGGANLMSPAAARHFIIIQGVIMTAGIGVAGYFLKDPPKNWWPKQIDPLHWRQRGTPDLMANPPALRHYTLRQMWRTPQAKWIGIQYACYVGCSLFGVAYYYGFGQAMNLGKWAYVGGAAGFALADGGFRPLYGWLSEYIGRRKTMMYAYSGNVIFQLLALWAGEAHQPALFALCAVISGGLSGANFPMTAAMVADYYGETNNAVTYGSIYAWKALGGSFAGGGAALVMTGTLYGTAHNNWPRGFIFGAVLGAIAALVVAAKCTPPTREQMQAAVRAAPDQAIRATPAIHRASTASRSPDEASR